MTEKEPILWNANYVKVMLSNFLIFFSFMLLTPLLPIYLSDAFGADKHQIGVVLFGYTVMALLSRLFSGWVLGFLLFAKRHFEENRLRN